MRKIDLAALRELHHNRSRQHWYMAQALASADYALDLSHLDLSTIRDWSNTDFSGVNLSDCNFSGCNLAYANFIGAVLTNADFSKANMIGLKNIQPNQLKNIKLDISRLSPYLRAQLKKSTAH